MSDILDIMKEKNVEEVALQFIDLIGVLHTLWIPSTVFSQACEEGIHTDGSSLAKMVDVSRSDVKLVPDMNSFVVLPPELFPNRIARVICDIYKPDSNKPFDLDPRFVLKKSIDDLKATLGSSVGVATSSEIEFFLFDKTKEGKIKLIDQAGYLASPPADRGAQLRLEITKALRTIGVLIEKHHHEVPHGKSEFNLPYSDALSMADTIYLVKFIIKLMADKAGFIASFMPKPFHGEYGAGLHTHINLRDEEKKSNLFSNSDSSEKLSPLAKNFLA
ncbi:MAG: glutamine synthetase beta-grasp domain-containing protein, partial [Candidatus Hodarchaeales archaeon]